LKSNLVEVHDSIIKIEEGCFGKKDWGPINLKSLIFFF